MHLALWGRVKHQRTGIDLLQASGQPQQTLLLAYDLLFSFLLQLHQQGAQTGPVGLTGILNRSAQPLQGDIQTAGFADQCQQIQIGSTEMAVAATSAGAYQALLFVQADGFTTQSGVSGGSTDSHAVAPSQAAPRTPLESPCTDCFSGVQTVSENT